MSRTARILSAIAVLAMALFPAACSDDEMDQVEKQAIEKVVREYLREHPEVLYQAMTELRQREEARKLVRLSDTLDFMRDELENDPGSPVGGNREGTVTVVEFFDYRCGFCKRVFPTVQRILEDDDSIRYVFKEYPILGPESVVAARAALAAWKLDEDSYYGFHTAMMASKGPLTNTKVMRFAAESGYDVKLLQAGMSEPWINQALERNRELASALGINGTPAFVIGNLVIPGAAEWETLVGAVEAARKELPTS